MKERLLEKLLGSMTYKFVNVGTKTNAEGFILSEIMVGSLLILFIFALWFHVMSACFGYARVLQRDSELGLEVATLRVAISRYLMNTPVRVYTYSDGYDIYADNKEQIGLVNGSFKWYLKNNQKQSISLDSIDGERYEIYTKRSNQHPIFQTTKDGDLWYLTWTVVAASDKNLPYRGGRNTNRQVATAVYPYYQYLDMETP